MDIDNRLYVAIVPLEGANQPHPHPISDGGFDPGYVYKVLGMYNASETSECYFVLANLQREIWFIPQRHLRAHALLDSDEFFLPLNSDATGNNGEPLHPRKSELDPIREKSEPLSKPLRWKSVP